MRLELAYPTFVSAGSHTPYNLSRTTPVWIPVNGDDIVGLDELHLEITREEGNQVKKKMTGDLLFYDNVAGTKTSILNAFYNSSTPVDYIWVRIYDCECEEWIFKGQITRDKLEWCSGECFLRCRASEYDETTDAYNSLNNVLNYDAYEADANEHYLNFMMRNGDTEVKKAHYQEAVRIGGMLKASIESLPEFKFSSSILNSLNNLNGWTGDYYAQDMGFTETGYVKSYLNPYFFAYLINADISKGLLSTKVGDFVRPEHKYVRTIRSFLDELKPIFNADYVIKKVGSEVHFIFERKDYFAQGADIWKDCTMYNACFNLDDRNRYSYADMKFQTPSNISDASDLMFQSLLINDIKEWNNPVSPLQKDSYQVLPMFAFAPMYEDSVGGRSDGGIGLRPPYTTVPPIIAIPGDLSHGTIYKGLGKYDTATFTATVYDYNTPMYFNGDVAASYAEYTGLPSSTGSFGSVYGYYRNCNLYDCFHFIENPRNTPNNVGYLSKYSRKYLQFEVEVQFSCAEYLSYTSDSSVLIDVNGVSSKGQINSIDFDFKKRTCRIRGII